VSILSAFLTSPSIRSFGIPTFGPLKFFDTSTIRSARSHTYRYDMASLPDLGCAVRADGSLKDASEIVWHQDKDDDAPLPGSCLAASGASSQVLHPFFSGIASPVARRSGRTSRPSNRVVDPDNAMNSAPRTSSMRKHVTGKRKAPINGSVHRRVIQKTVCVSGDSGNDNSDADLEDPMTSRAKRGKSTDAEESEEDAVGARKEYESLMAMADADHKVSLVFTSRIVHLTHLSNFKVIHTKSKLDATADIRTMFRREKERKNPDTGKLQDGHWCKLCL
jgi:hypothetical protein